MVWVAGRFVVHTKKCTLSQFNDSLMKSTVFGSNVHYLDALFMKLEICNVMNNVLPHGVFNIVRQMTEFMPFD
jgi:hypothetical protein